MTKKSAEIWTRNAVLCLILAGLIISSYSAGPLWRDEVHSVQIASRSWSQIVEAVKVDSCPLFHYLVLKLWQTICPVPGDAGLRLLGFLISVCGVFAFLSAARAVGNPNPALFLGFFFLHPIYARYIGTLRTYGISTVFLLLTFFCLACLLTRERNRPWHYAVTWLCATLLVQTHYLNALYLGVLAVAFTAACLRFRRRQLLAGGWLAILLALGTLLPYLPFLLASREWAQLFQSDIPPAKYLANIWNSLATAGTVPTMLILVTWTVIVVRTLTLRQITPQAWFGLLAGIGAPLGFFLTLVIQHSPFLPWYMLLPTVLAAVAGETGIAAWRKNCSDAKPDNERPSHSEGSFVPALPRPLQIACLGPSIAFLLMLAAMLPASFTGLRTRQTNMDLVAKAVQALEKPGDLVVLTRFYYACGFNYYYRGALLWTAIPPVPDQSLQRFDMVWEEIKAAGGRNPGSPLLIEIRRTLRRGGRVWVIGYMPVEPLRGPAEEWSVAASAPPAERFNNFMTLWPRQIMTVVTEEALRSKYIEADPGQEVNGIEDLPLVLFYEPRGKAPAQTPGGSN